MKDKKLNKVFDEFTNKMRDRLTQKEDEGFTGWQKVNLFGKSYTETDRSKYQ